MHMPLKSLLATAASISLVLAQPISNDAGNLDPRGLSKLLPLGQNKGLEKCRQDCQSQFEQNLKKIPPVDSETPLKKCVALCVSQYPKGKLSSDY